MEYAEMVYKKHSEECQAIVFPAFLQRDTCPLGKTISAIWG